MRAASEGIAVAEITASSERGAVVARLREALAQLADGGGDSAAGRDHERWARQHAADDVADRHSPIVDAIEKGDVPAAVAVVEEHMAAAAEHFADARDAD